MQVLKFGGTSVGNAESIIKVCDILMSHPSDSNLIVVVSAQSGITDKLLLAGTKARNHDPTYLEILDSIQSRLLKTVRDLGLDAEVSDKVSQQLGNLKSLIEGVYIVKEFSDKTKDKVLSFGELMSSIIITGAMKSRELDTVFKDSRQLLITDSKYTNASINPQLTQANVKEYFSSHSNKITVLPGFIASNRYGETTTLGRGGSDYTAALVAEAIDASMLEIWTDVSGMYTSNPKLVKQAFPIDRISYHEAMELSHFGAKVLFPPSIKPVLEKEIPILIKNTFAPEDPGTFISSEVDYNNGPVKGISHLSDISLLTLEGNGMIGVPGFSGRLFNALAIKDINIILITQASSEHSVCIGLQTKDSQLAAEAINDEFAYEISLGDIDHVLIENDLAIIALVGDKMKNHQNISGRMFGSLGQNNVNIVAIAQGASERNISAVISKSNVRKALNTLHYRFFEEQIRVLNLFIVGLGNVGQKLLTQIQDQQKYLYENQKLKINITGICNSRKMCFDPDGLDLKKWHDLIKNGDKTNDEIWRNKIEEFNLQNSVFIDITASPSVANSYQWYLNKSISVVACNKIASSSDLESFENLKDLSLRYNVPFLFETNVGAGLPIINTLNNLIASGDKIIAIKAVLSGSLNFVFNNFNETNSFDNIVKRAQEEGYTEPDPRIDLSGIDVARKILILARESGYRMNIEDIENIGFLPSEAMQVETVEEFYQILKENANYFKELFLAAKEKSCKLKYVAEFANGKAKVSLQEIEIGHPFFDLSGKDNIVLFYTERYKEQPLIIKGAGAGADVTASGLFADIIRIGKS
jgi:aspartokinase/homoserine dehydrogenase 1